MTASLLDERHIHHSPARGPLECVAIALLLGMTFWIVIEMPGALRNAWITEYEIGCVGALALFSSPILLLLSGGNWNRREIKLVELWRPKEGPNRFNHGLMVIVRKFSKSVRVGIPASLPLEQVAQTLHEQGISVALKDWVPVEEPQTSGIAI